MARMNADQKAANLAACLVMLSDIILELLAGQVSDHKSVRDKLIACQEIAGQCVSEKMEGEFTESLAAIHSFRTPDHETAEVMKPEKSSK